MRPPKKIYIDDHEIKVTENGELYQVCTQTLRFKESMQGNDLQLLARNFDKEILAMLYEKKLQLEEELSKL